MITSLATLKAANLIRTAQSPAFLSFGTTVSFLANTWKYGAPIVGADPPAFTAGSGYVPNNSTAGALKLPTLAAACENRLGRLRHGMQRPDETWLVDIVWHCKAFDSNSVALQTITTPGTAGRQTDYTGCRLMWTCYTAIGANADTWTVSFTNQAGTAGQLATFAKGAAAANPAACGFFDVPAGTTGVQAVASFQATGGSGTSGDIGLSIVRPIGILSTAGVAVAATTPDATVMRDYMQLGGPSPIPDQACLTYLIRTINSYASIPGGAVFADILQG